MPKCPQCAKPLREMSRRCPSCQADLDLLVDYVSHLHGGLERAENLSRDGQLAESVWAYLEVLETDPGNVAARAQVSRLVTAVRQFDVSSPARRHAAGLPPPDDRPAWQRLPYDSILLALSGVLFGLLLGMLISRPPAPPRAVEPVNEGAAPAPLAPKDDAGRMGQ